MLGVVSVRYEKCRDAKVRMMQYAYAEKFGVKGGQSVLYEIWKGVTKQKKAIIAAQN